MTTKQFNQSVTDSIKNLINKAKVPESLTGQRFGRLTVKRYNGRQNGLKYYKCYCDCGNVKTVREGHLKQGKIKSCGCIVRTREGLSVISPLMYAVWRSMHARCYNPKTKSFRFYGARGIKVCERWFDIRNFLTDMGDRPKGKTVERIDNDGDYEPGNCRWATYHEQGNNTRNNHRITIDGISKTISQWSRESSVSRRAIGMRIDRGWSERAAIFTPRGQGKTYPQSFEDWLASNSDSIEMPLDRTEATAQWFDDQRAFDGEDAEEWMRRSEQQGE